MNNTTKLKSKCHDVHLFHKIKFSTINNLIITLDFNTVLYALHYLSEQTDQLHGYKIIHTLKTHTKCLTISHYANIKLFIYINLNLWCSFWWETIEQCSNADFFQLCKYMKYGTCKKSPFSVPWYFSKAVFLKWIVEPLNCLYQAAQVLAKNANFSVTKPLMQNL